MNIKWEWFSLEIHKELKMNWHTAKSLKCLKKMLKIASLVNLYKGPFSKAWFHILYLKMHLKLKYVRITQTIYCNAILYFLFHLHCCLMPFVILYSGWDKIFSPRQLLFLSLFPFGRSNGRLFSLERPLLSTECLL